MTKGVGTKIGELIGVLEDVGIAGDGVGWGRCLRLRVTIDITKPLDRGRALELNGKTTWVEFRYEKLPLFCFSCGRIVHGEKGCPVPKSTRLSAIEGPKPWRVWLCAEDQKRKLPEGGSSYTADGRWQHNRGGRGPSDDNEQGGLNPHMESSSKRGNPDFRGTDRISNLGEGESSCHLGGKILMPYMERNFLVEEDGESSAGIGTGKRNEGNVYEVGTGVDDGADSYGRDDYGLGSQNLIEEKVQLGSKRVGLGLEKIHDGVGGSRGVNEPSLGEPGLSRLGSFIFGLGSSSSRARVGCSSK